MTNVHGTYTDRIKLVRDIKNIIGKSPDTEVLRERLRQAPQSGSPAVYVLPYNVLLSARGFLLAVPKGTHDYYRPLRAVRMQHNVPSAPEAEAEIMRSIHAYVMDPNRSPKPAGDPYTALQRSQMTGLAVGVWQTVSSPWRALRKWAVSTPDTPAPGERRLMLPWFEG